MPVLGKEGVLLLDAEPGLLVLCLGHRLQALLGQRGSNVN
jgi:hypothetical protein